MLIDYGSRFAESKLRQLRLAGFIEVNKLGDGLPRTKNAIIMRAYRQPPIYGFCPNPESSWSKQARPSLERLEALLFYYHTTCKPTFDQMEDWERAELLSNIFVAAADAFIKRKARDKDTEILLLATYKYFEQVRAKMKEFDDGLDDDHLGHRPNMEMDWIDYPAVAAKAKAMAKGTGKGKGKGKGAADDEGRLVPTVLTRSEAHFSTVDAGQMTRVDTPVESHSTRLPWDSWLISSAAQDLSMACHDMEAIGLVLQSLHRNHTFLTAQKVSVVVEDNQKWVTAVAGMEAGCLMLPPCIPRSARILKESNSSYRVPIQVFRAVAESELSEPEAQAVPSLGPRTFGAGHTYYIVPEFKTPADVSDDSAGAAEWEYDGTETMHPFWAVRRMTPDALRRATTSLCPLRHNVELTSKQLHTMVVGSLGERHGIVDSCYRVVVPFWTNPFKLMPFEELIGPLTPSPKKDKQATTWRDDAKQVEKRAANSGAKAPAAKKKPKTNSGDRFDALDIDHNASEI